MRKSCLHRSVKIINGDTDDNGVKLMNRNKWLDGVMGVVIGDALGCPVQFIERAELASGPVDDMEGYGTYNMPEGTWTDDSSMTLALLASIREKGTIDLPDIMYRFALWLTKG